jgi:hypothetical protein
MWLCCRAGCLLLVASSRGAGRQAGTALALLALADARRARRADGARRQRGAAPRGLPGGCLPGGCLPVASSAGCWLRAIRPAAARAAAAAPLPARPVGRPPPAPPPPLAPPLRRRLLRPAGIPTAAAGIRTRTGGGLCGRSAAQPPPPTLRWLRRQRLFGWRAGAGLPVADSAQPAAPAPARRILPTSSRLTLSRRPSQHHKSVAECRLSLPAAHDSFSLGIRRARACAHTDAAGCRWAGAD